jgi:hypothetical protein
MPDLKLAKLPDRTPIKLAILVTPDLSDDLAAYADAYKAQYGRAESVIDLVPHMLRAFLDSDRAFIKNRTKP